MLKKNLLKISDFSRAVYRPERSESCSLMFAYQVCPLWRGKEWRLTAARPLARSHANMSLWRDPFQGVTGHSRPRWNKSDVSPSRLWNSILPHRLGEAWEVINNRNHCGNHWGKKKKKNLSSHRQVFFPTQGCSQTFCVFRKISTGNL